MSLRRSWSDRRYGAAALLLLLGCGVATASQPASSAVAAAVTQGPARSAPAQAAPAGPPALAPARVQAFAGVWGVTQSAKTTPVPPRGAIPLTPAYELRREQLQRMDESGQVIPGRNAKCIPDGLPDMMTFGFRIEANADYLTIIGGTGPTIRLVWLDRTRHTPSRLLFPTYGGESIGHWEGDTLVVDTVGLNSGNEITYALPVNDENMHIIERWRLRSPRELQIVTTIESKVALTRPWTYTNVYGRRALTAPIEYCDRPDIGNKMDLTPPTGGYIPPGATQ